MNKIFFITFALGLILSTSTIDAQENDRPRGRQFDREAFQARRNAFITAEMGLTPTEAGLFIPLCNELQQKMFEIGNDCRKLHREMHKRKDLTDADYLKVIDECLEVSLRETQLEKEYYDQFKKILPPAKLFKYKDAEDKFMRHYFSSHRESNERNGNERGRDDRLNK